jgi:hypothetical protein
LGGLFWVGFPYFIANSERPLSDAMQILLQ